MMKSFLILILFTLSFSKLAEARHFTFSDSLLAEGDSLITNRIFFKSKKKSDEQFLHKKSLAFIDSLASFLLNRKDVEIEIIRFHSAMVQKEYKFIEGDCKPYGQLDLVANYLANQRIAILRIRLRICQDLPIATNFGMEKLTIIRITKADKESISPF